MDFRRFFHGKGYQIERPGKRSRQRNINRQQRSHRAVPRPRKPINYTLAAGDSGRRVEMRDGARYKIMDSGQYIRI